MKLNFVFPEQKRRNSTPLFIIALLSPYLFGFGDKDSAYTTIKFGAGGGQYVYYDCSGAHPQEFSDAGLYIGKKFDSPFRVGLSGSMWNARSNSSRGFVYPDLALDWKSFSIGTTGIRIGALDNYYFEISGADEVPYLSGKGFLRTGVGMNLEKPFLKLWIGANVLPYHTIGAASQIEMPLKEGKYLFLNGRIGNEAGYKEYGISVGIRMQYH